MAQVEVLVLVLAAAAEAAVRRLFPLGLLRGHYHLYPPTFPPAEGAAAEEPSLPSESTARHLALSPIASGAACACAMASKSHSKRNAQELAS